MPRDANSSAAPYFIHHRDHPGPEAYIGPPEKSRINGEWVMTVSRRISRPDGSFAGVALATIPLSYLRDFYAGLDLGPNGVIALLRDSGALVPALVLGLCAGVALLGTWRLWPAFAQAARHPQRFAHLLGAATRGERRYWFDTGSTIRPRPRTRTRSLWHFSPGRSTHRASSSTPQAVSRQPGC